jgi:hypothetical protein
LGLDQSEISIENTQVTGLGTSSVVDVPATGDAATDEVVLGSDTRLTNERTPVDGSVTTAKIADANVTNAKLENDSVVLGGTTLTLGGSTDVVDTLTVTTLTSVTANIDDAIVFEGSLADGFETTLRAQEPTADNTVIIQNYSGTLPLVEHELLHLNMPSTAVDVSARLDNQAATLTSGTAYFTYFTPLKDIPVTSISVSSAGTAFSGTSLAKFGLYSYDETTATLLAETASDVTIFGIRNTLYTRMFSAARGYPMSYTLRAGSRYAIAILWAGSTPGTVYLAHGIAPASVVALSPKLNGSLASQVDLPATALPVTTVNIGPWGRLS